jgi:hypothetical protein
MTADMRKMLEEFSKRPLSELTYERLQSLYDKLLNYQFENEGNISKAENDCLSKTLDLIQKEMNHQYFNGDSLTKLLVENPWEVENVLSELSLQNLFEMVKRGEQIKCKLLRQQFMNMINRCAEDLAFEATAEC